MDAIKTGIGVAMMRAIMAFHPRESRLFGDRNSAKLLPPGYRLILAFMKGPKRFRSLAANSERGRHTRKSGPGRKRARLFGYLCLLRGAL